MTFFERSRLYFDVIPHRVREGVAVLCIAAAGLMWWSYSGVFRLLADIQIAIGGAYFPSLTALFTWVAIMPVAMVATRMIVVNLGHQIAAEEGAAQRVAADERSRRWATGPGKALMVTAMGFGVAGWAIVTYALMGSIQDATPGEVARGETASRVLRMPIRELALLDAAVYVDDGSASRDWYLPLVDPAEPDGPFRVFAMTGTGQHTDDPLEDVEDAGVLQYTPLPGHVTVLFQELGLPLGEETFVVDFDDSPEDRLVFAAIFGGMGALALGWYGILRWRTSR
jgi:hypothetical protein